MALVYPLYGRSSPCDVLISRPQVQELHFRNGKFRLSGFQAVPVGYLSAPSPRSVPTSTFVPGAPTPSTARTREDIAYLGLSGA